MLKNVLHEILWPPYACYSRLRDQNYSTGSVRNVRHALQATIVELEKNLYHTYLYSERIF